MLMEQEEKACRPRNKNAFACLQAHLLRSAAVKDVHPDRRLTRALAFEHAGGEPFRGGGVGGGATPTANFHHSHEEDFVRRRPGRRVSS